jgi:hypothetical protein
MTAAGPRVCVGFFLLEGPSLAIRPDCALSAQVPIRCGLRAPRNPRAPVALSEEFGPDEPWPFVSSDYWACDHCALREACPGGDGF